MNEHRLDLAASIAAAGAGGKRRRWHCLDDALLAAYAQGTVPPAAAGPVESHLADCAFCRGQLGFLLRAERLGPAPPVPAHLLALASGARERWIGVLRPSLVAAAWAVFGMALLLSPQGRHVFPAAETPSGPQVSAPANSAADRLVRKRLGPAEEPWIVQPAEGAVVTRGALELRWREASGAVFYTVELVDAKGDVVWDGRAEGARVTVPADVPLASGQPYFAWVLAHLRSGAVVRSPAVGFRVAPG